MSDSSPPDEDGRAPPRAMEDDEPAERPARERAVLPLWFEGLDLSSAFPLAFTRRVLRRGLRRTRSDRWETVGQECVELLLARTSPVRWSSAEVSLVRLRASRGWAKEFPF